MDEEQKKQINAAIAIIRDFASGVHCQAVVA